MQFKSITLFKMSWNSIKIIPSELATHEDMQINEFQLICRVCLKRYNNLISIAEYEIIKMITTCASVEISLNDGLPNHICQYCLNALHTAFNFKQLLELSDKNLRKTLQKRNLNKNVVVKTEPVETDRDSVIENIDDTKNVIEDKMTVEIFHDSINTKSIKIEPEFENDIKIKSELCNEPTPVPFENTDVKCDKKLSPTNEVKTNCNKEKLNTCYICNKSFNRPSKLECHMAVHSDERPHQCSECGKTFKLLQTLKKHKKYWHINKNSFECDECDKKYCTKVSLLHHKETHKNNGKLIKCDKCPKQFLRQKSLLHHTRRIHEKVPRNRRHLCNICGYSVDYRFALKLHMLTHSDNKSFQCDKCDMKYKSRAGLRGHILTVHLNLKPFACTICSRSFRSKAILENHTRTHTGERPFQCIICELTFAQKVTLQTHIKLIHVNNK